MKRLSMLLVAVGYFACTLVAQAQVEWVDPTIGGVGILLVPTRPTVHMPNSMVRMYPVRADQVDDQIHSFPLTVISHRFGEYFWLMPHDGLPGAAAWDRPAAYDQETTTPYYYSTRLDDSLIRVEFTPTERCGYYRFTYPKGNACVLLANRQPGSLSVEGDRIVTGTERFNGMPAFFYGEFNYSVALALSGQPKKNRVAASARTKQDVLEFRYGISFISVEQAKRNLQREIPAWDFDSIKNRAKNRWNELLGQIQVEGGTEAQRRVFYTALYRCHERMVNITEDGRYYHAWDHKVHEDPRPFYVDCWIWDMFRTVEPLDVLLNPEMVADELQSYVRMYQQSGWMPRFAELWGTIPAMNANHTAAWIADAWFKGVRNFNLKKAYEGLRKNSLEATLLPWRTGPKCPVDDFYNEHGYMPALRPGEKETEPGVYPADKRETVSVTLGNSYDDWCIAELARTLGDTPDYQLFLKRAGNYKNLFRADNGFFWPKDTSGKWIEPMDPKFDGGLQGRDYYDENNGYTYNWDVLHDHAGMFALMGGRAKAEARLDQLFREGLGRSKWEFFAKFPDSSSMVGQFSMGNEPSFSIPYLYNRLGAPWKTQKRIRALLEAFFTDELTGIPGDEDGGAMSAFAVFSMLGFYPVTAGMPTYDLGSPVFDKATIRLGNGKTITMVCHDNSRNNKYVQSVRLNGQPMDRIWFRHADIINGATLEIQMGNTPNRTLGVAPATLPPCSMALDPRDFAAEP